VHANMGWRLLMNENVKIEKEGAILQLVGIENWSVKARFPKYGKMEQAMSGVQPELPIILMSHDPSHWECNLVWKIPILNGARFNGCINNGRAYMKNSNSNYM